MVIADARDPATRKADMLAMLASPAIDVWVATASAAGRPHLVPVSLAWVDERVVIAADDALGEAYVRQADSRWTV